MEKMLTHTDFSIGTVARKTMKSDNLGLGSIEMRRIIRSIIFIVIMAFPDFSLSGTNDVLFWTGTSNIVGVAMGYLKERRLISGDTVTILSETANQADLASSDLGVLFYALYPMRVKGKWFFARNTPADPERLHLWYSIGDLYYFPFLESPIVVDGERRTPQSLLSSDLFTTPQGGLSDSVLYIQAVVGRKMYVTPMQITMEIERLDQENQRLLRQDEEAKKSLQKYPRPSRDSAQYREQLAEYQGRFAAQKKIESALYDIKIKLRELNNQLNAMRSMNRD
jgi:hypothetical protein